LVVIFLNLEIYSVQFYYVDLFLKKYDFFAKFFTALAIIFIINGSNFIDGFNGLLAIHALIISFFLIPIFFIYNQFELFQISILFFIFLIVFLFFNFPIAKIFLGNAGAYLVGFTLSFLTIKASEITSYHKIYPFYFAILLYFLFFEVFFSFFRKAIYEKRNPLMPDKKHLHMLLFYKTKSHVKTSLYLNIYFLISILPIIFLSRFPGLLKIYFVLLIISYLSFYLSLLKKK